MDAPPAAGLQRPLQRPIFTGMTTDHAKPATAGLQLDEAGLTILVDRFYERVRADAELGPIFNDAIDDWPEHLEKLTAFWSSLMLTSGRYKGAPMAAHLKHRARLTPAMFERWLALWREATEAEMPPAIAQLMQVKAERIAESLQLAMFYRPDRPWGLARARNAPTG